MKRSFILCELERIKVELLTDLIETGAGGTSACMLGDPDGYQCNGKVIDENGSKVWCENVRRKSNLDFSRNVTLFTLNHGEVGIVLLDWRCDKCMYINRYYGFSHRIFPASAGIAYTIEVMYSWVQEMCLHTISFRSVYQSFRLVRFSTSYERRFDTGRLKVLKLQHRSNRWVGNDEVRSFIQSIDV